MLLFVNLYDFPDKVVFVRYLVRIVVLFSGQDLFASFFFIRKIFGFSGQRQMGRLHVRDYVTFSG